MLNQNLSSLSDVPSTLNDNSPTERGLPRDASLYICWYSELRHLLSQCNDWAGTFRVAALPGGGFKGDWHLRVLPGSVSQGLGNAVADALTSRDEDYRRFAMGVGLPVGNHDGDGTSWLGKEFRGWPGAAESVNLEHIYAIHKKAHRRSSIPHYRMITRVLSTLARRLAGDWEADTEMSQEIIAAHLRRLGQHLTAFDES